MEKISRILLRYLMRVALSRFKKHDASLRPYECTTRRIKELVLGITFVAKETKYRNTGAFVLLFACSSCLVHLSLEILGCTFCPETGRVFGRYYFQKTSSLSNFFFFCEFI